MAASERVKPDTEYVAEPLRPRLIYLDLSSEFVPFAQSVLSFYFLPGVLASFVSRRFKKGNAASIVIPFFNPPVSIFSGTVGLFLKIF